MYSDKELVEAMNNTVKKISYLSLSVAAAATLAGCGGGGGTPTLSYNAPIAQPTLPGTVIQILQANGSGGYVGIPANADGSYSITDSNSVLVNAQTTQGLGQSIQWGFSATDGGGYNYVPLTTGGYQVSGSADPILQNVGYSSLAAVPSAVSNPTGSFPLQFVSQIAPGGNLVLGLGQGLTLASAAFQSSAVFRVVSAYAGSWSVSYSTGGSTPAYTGTCNINISNTGVVAGSCTDAQLGTYDVTGRDYGAGNAMGVQFQGKNGIVNFFMGTSPVALNLLQGKSNMFVNSTSTSVSGTSGSNSSAVTTVYAVDPFACDLIPGKTFIQVANPTTCASSNTVLFGTNSSSTSTPATTASGAQSSNTTGSTGTGLPVTWTATKTS